MQIGRHVQSQNALGGTVTIGIVVDNSHNTNELFRNAWRQTYQFERQFSRFLPASELSQFNARAGSKLPVSPEFAAILHRAKQLADATDGLFNPFILPALQRTGYRSSAVARYIDDSAPDYSERRIVAPSKLELGSDWARIPYGTALDLGGCGKGYLADQLGSYLRSQGAQGYWVELSGDIATFGHDEHGDHFTVAIKNAMAQGDLDEVIVCPFTPFGIATSGTFQRITQVGTIRGHHIIDSRSGLPAKTDLLLATVCAASATEADVLASCTVIVGSQASPKLLRQHKVKAWLLQSDKATERHGRYIKNPKMETLHA